jgi:hypothetical protein
LCGDGATGVPYVVHMHDISRTEDEMKYFMNTHDKAKGSFPQQELTEEQFFAQFASLEEAAAPLGVFGHAAHVNLKEGKAFCFMSGPDEESVRKAHEASAFPTIRSPRCGV